MPIRLLPQLIEQMTDGVVILQFEHPGQADGARVAYANDAGGNMLARLMALPGTVTAQPPGAELPVSELPADLLAQIAHARSSHSRRVHKSLTANQRDRVEAEIIPLTTTHVAVLLREHAVEARALEITHAPEILESVLLNAPIGLAFLDTNYRYVRINQALAEMNGMAVADHLGRTVREVLSDIGAAIEHLIEQVFTTGQSLVDIEITGQTQARPGQQRTWLTGIYPIYVHQTIDYVGVIVTEITQRKQAEAALQESEARFRRTFENAGVGIGHVGLDGSWLRVNQRLCDIVGRTREELLAGNFQAITHADDLDTDLALYAQLIAGEIESYRMEKRYYHRDGHIVWINLTTAMERAPDGTPLYCISVVHDITATKVAEARLRVLARASGLLASSLDYGETLQSIADLMVAELADWCSVDLILPDDRIAQVALAHTDPEKPAWARALRQAYPVDPNAPSGIAAVIRSGHSLLLADISDELLQSGVQNAAHLAHLRGLNLTSGIIVPLQTRGQTLGALTLVSAESGRRYTESDVEFLEELAQRAALAVDNAGLYAAARHAEAELRAANKTLEERIAERTQELERSNRELQDFAYVASHDLQEPLRKVIAFGDRLQQKYAPQLDPTATDYITRMQQAAVRMQRLINDLLALSRVTTGGHPFTAVDLMQTIAIVLDDLETARQESGGSIIIDELPLVRGDRSQLHQLFQNLIVNALKFRREGQCPEVRIAVCPDRAENPKFVCIDVIDNGIGFEQQYAERIFQPFQRLHGRDAYVGTGMGLAICRRIVERHGGRISATGTPNGGATFRVTLPGASR